MTSPEISLSRLHHPVTALGFGVRAGIWVQGCTLACPGCLARDTWEARPDRAVPVPSVIDWLAALPPVDGITISGGEPLEQPSLAALLTAIAAWRGDRPVDILLYTGYGWGRVGRHAGVRAHCDAVIAGRYVEARNTGDTPLRGSANQVIVPLTELGRTRYADPPPGGLQVSVVDGRLWMVGIPRRGDVDRVVDSLRARGVAVDGGSWTT